jgi:hypothetical protein
MDISLLNVKKISELHFVFGFSSAFCLQAFVHTLESSTHSNAQETFSNKIEPSVAVMTDTKSIFLTTTFYARFEKAYVTLYDFDCCL